MSTATKTASVPATVNRVSPQSPIDQFIDPALMSASVPVQQSSPPKSRVSASTIHAAQDANLNEADILRLLAEYDQLSVNAKLIYSRKDDIEATLMEVLRPGDIIKMADGRTATIEDNFDGIDKKTGKRKNVSWKPCGVKRFEISITARRK